MANGLTFLFPIATSATGINNIAAIATFDGVFQSAGNGNVIRWCLRKGGTTKRRPLPEDPDKVVRAVGRRIAELRAERGLTQEQFAEHYGATVKYIQRVEAGRQNVSVRTLVKLANTLRAKTADLLVAPTTLRSTPGRPKTRR